MTGLIRKLYSRLAAGLRGEEQRGKREDRAVLQGTEAAEAGAGDNQGTAALPEVRRYLKDAVVAATVLAAVGEAVALAIDGLAQALHH